MPVLNCSGLTWCFIIIRQNSLLVRQVQCCHKWVIWNCWQLLWKPLAGVWILFTDVYEPWIDFLPFIFANVYLFQSTPPTCRHVCPFRTFVPACWQAWARPSATGSITHWWLLLGLAWFLSPLVSIQCRTCIFHLVLTLCSGFNQSQRCSPFSYKRWHSAQEIWSPPR